MTHLLLTYAHEDRSIVQDSFLSSYVLFVINMFVIQMIKMYVCMCICIYVT
jgi:hypothetical protein